MKSNNQVINLSKHTDKNYGYLSNDSPHSFVDERNIVWPTVTHYIEAKKFKGTQYEDEIRKSKTPLQAKRKTRERHMIIAYTKGDTFEIESRKVVGNKKYGISRNNTNNYNKTLEENIYTALKLKFNQHPKLLDKLVSTKTSKIIGNNNIFNTPNNIINTITANNLMKIRDERISTLKVISRNKRLTAKDIPPLLLLNSKVILIRKVLIKIAKYISKMEGWQIIYPEMIEDAIYNILRRNTSKFKKFKKYKKSYLSNSNSRDKTINSPPNLNKFIHRTQHILDKIDPLGEKHQISSTTIAYFVLWCYITGKINVIYRRSIRYDRHDISKAKPSIVIPPGIRSYRKLLPPKYDNIIKKSILQEDLSHADNSTFNLGEHVEEHFSNSKYEELSNRSSNTNYADYNENNFDKEDDFISYNNEDEINKNQISNTEDKVDLVLNT